MLGDPSELWWPSSAAIALIMWRNLDAAYFFSNSALSQGKRRVGWPPSDHVTKADFEAAVDRFGEPAVKFNAAVQFLYGAAKSGTVRSRGIPLGADWPEGIRPDCWSYLELQADSMIWASRGGELVSGYGYVLHRRDDLLSTWAPDWATVRVHRAVSGQSPRGYEVKDEPLLEEMKRRIQGGETVAAAARKVADRAAGNSTLESKAKRLAKRFKSSPPSI